VRLLESSAVERTEVLLCSSNRIGGRNFQFFEPESPIKTRLVTYFLVFLLLTYLLTYLFHEAESYLRS